MNVLKKVGTIVGGTLFALAMIAGGLNECVATVDTSPERWTDAREAEVAAQLAEDGNVPLEIAECVAWFVREDWTYQAYLDSTEAEGLKWLADNGDEMREVCAE